MSSSFLILPWSAKLCQPALTPYDLFDAHKAWSSVILPYSVNTQGESAKDDKGASLTDHEMESRANPIFNSTRNSMHTMFPLGTRN